MGDHDLRWRAGRLGRALLTAAAVVAGSLAVFTVLALHKGTGSLRSEGAAVAEVGDCRRSGPIGWEGIGHHWECDAVIRTADRSGVPVVLDRSKVTPADTGRQVRLRERCTDDGCSYGRPTPWLWTLGAFLLLVVWRFAAVFSAGLALWWVAAAVLGPRRAGAVVERLRRSETAGADVPVLPRATIAVERTAGPGVTLDLRRPEPVALYRTARPVVRIGADERTLDWGEHALALPRGRHRIEVVVVAYATPLLTTQAAATVPVRPGRGAVVRYEAPVLG